MFRRSIRTVAGHARRQFQLGPSIAESVSRKLVAMTSHRKEDGFGHPTWLAQRDASRIVGHKSQLIDGGQFDQRNPATRIIVHNNDLGRSHIGIIGLSVMSQWDEENGCYEKEHAAMPATSRSAVGMEHRKYPAESVLSQRDLRTNYHGICQWDDGTRSVASATGRVRGTPLLRCDKTPRQYPARDQAARFLPLNTTINHRASSRRGTFGSTGRSRPDDS